MRSGRLALPIDHQHAEAGGFTGAADPGIGAHADVEIGRVGLDAGAARDGQAAFIGQGHFQGVELAGGAGLGGQIQVERAIRSRFGVSFGNHRAQVAVTEGAEGIVEGVQPAGVLRADLVTGQREGSGSGVQRPMQAGIASRGVEEVTGVDLGFQVLPGADLAGGKADLQVDLGLAVAGNFEVQPEVLDLGAVDVVFARLGGGGQGKLAVGAAKGIQGQVERGDLQAVAIVDFERQAGQIRGQGIAPVVRLAHHRPEVDGVAGTIDGPVGVQVSHQAGRVPAVGQVEVPGADALVPVGGRQAEEILPGLAQHGIGDLVRLVDRLERGAENALAVGLAGGKGRAGIGVQGDGDIGDRGIAAQVYRPNQGVAGADFIGKLDVADHQQTEGVAAILVGQVEAQVI